ncbi:MAG: CPBP family intramembrane metalloprotease [Anaerolineae bacterium]|nr:CPBP family intramembrane metalloprotease [Anaerolineae bacterium]
MDDDAQPARPISQTRPTTGWDLLFYLLGGFGLFLLLSIAAGLLLRTISIWLTLTAYALNVFCLGGSVYLLGIVRNKLSWLEMGFWPVVWRWRWLLLAVGLSIAFIPLRVALGLAVQFLLEGNLDSLQGRTDILTAGGDLSLLHFLLNLVGAGLLVPIAEELYFRGLLYGWFKTRMGFWVRVLASSAIFGLAHFDSVAVIASSFVLGLVNAIAYEKSKSLWLPIAIHMVTNSAAIVLMYLAMLLVQLMPPV